MGVEGAGAECADLSQGLNGTGVDTYHRRRGDEEYLRGAGVGLEPSFFDTVWIA